MKAHLCLALSIVHSARASLLRRRRGTAPDKYRGLRTTAIVPTSSCGGDGLDGIRQLFVFGDSWSDVGNIYNASNETQPDSLYYYDGRYSNGRNYVDFLGQMLGIEISTRNIFAWGGATTNNSYIEGESSFLNTSVPSVNIQIENYTQIYGTMSDDAVFIIMAGYNDYWWYIYRGGDLQTSALENVANHVTSNIAASMELLFETRAKLLMIGDLPNMAAFPDAKSKTPEQVRAYAEVSEIHNTLLRSKLDTFRLDHLDVRVILIPFSETMVAFGEQRDCLGYTSVHDACLINDQVCRDPFGFVFYDDWHPTTQSHKRMADVIIQTLTSCSS